MSFFHRPPEAVAGDIVGRTVRFGNRVVRITAALPVNPDRNAMWEKRPLFVRNVPFYVGPYRGSALAFFLTTLHPLTCVRLQEGTDAEGNRLANPTAICRALGITSEFCGTVTVTEDGFLITEI